MKNRLRRTIILAAFSIVMSGLATGFAKTSVAAVNPSAEDAKVYAEVKAAIEKYEASLNAEPTMADLHQVAVTAGPGVKDSPAKAGDQFGEIIIKCDQLIKHDAQVPDYYRLRGKARYYRAITNTPYMFIESVSLADPDFVGRFSAADLAAGISDFSTALSVNSTGKLENLDAADAYLFRGKLLAISAAKTYSKENLQKALIDFDESIKRNGWDPPPDGFRKGIYLLSKDGDLVGQDFARRIKEDPSIARHIYLERARYLGRIVEYSKTLADLLRYAASSDAKSAADKSIIGLTYATLNRYAGDAYKKPRPAAATDYLEKASLEVQFPNKQDDAFNDATEAVKRNPQLTSAHVILAKVLVDKRKTEEGIAEANLALAQDPENVGALCIRGLAFAMNNDLRTLADFDRAIELDPELAFLYNGFGNRARVFTALGKTELAAADMQKNEQLARVLAEIRK